MNEVINRWCCYTCTIETLARQNKSAIKSEIMLNQPLVEEVHMLIIRKFKKRKMYSSVKGCIHYVFASFFFKCKREQEKCFLFHFKSSFRSQENQILELCILKFHDVIKCLSVTQENTFH